MQTARRNVGIDRAPRRQKPAQNRQHILWPAGLANPKMRQVIRAQYHFARRRWGRAGFRLGFGLEDLVEQFGRPAGSGFFFRTTRNEDTRQAGKKGDRSNGIQGKRPGIATASARCSSAGACNQSWFPRYIYNIHRQTIFSTQSAQRSCRRNFGRAPPRVPVESGPFGQALAGSPPVAGAGRRRLETEPPQPRCSLHGPASRQP